MKKKSIEHIDLTSIKNPDFLKDLSYKELNVLSKDIQDYLVEVTSKTGGHLSSNLGVVDVTLALCRIFDFQKDKIIFDVGHQSYTYKLLTGRDLTKLRKKDGISGFQKMDESNYDHYEAGHSSTSISAALGMAIARDERKEDYQVISFIGDSSIVNGVAVEALNNASQLKNKIIVVVNDNDMSISKSVGGISHVFRKVSISTFYRRSRNAFKKMMSLTRAGRYIYKSAKRFKNFIKRILLRTSVFDQLGFSIVGPVDGHNIKEMEKYLSKAKKNDRSTIIVLKTIKGKGYKYAEEDIEGKWHGVPSFNKETGEFYQSKDISWSKFFSHLIENKMAEDNSSYTIAPGTGYGSGLSLLFKRFPKRMIDVGIAEEHAFILASGLAVNGMHPNICIYSTFLQRAYDEIAHDLARLKLDSTILVDRAGLVGSDGETHQGIYDEAFLATIPFINITMPSNTYEAKHLYDESYKHHGPFFIRFPKTNIVKTTLNYPLEYGKWVKFTEGKKALISVGPVVNELYLRINKEHLDYALYNALYIKPLDVETLNKIMHQYDEIIVYDPYSTKYGLTMHISNYLSNHGYKGKLTIKAIDDDYVKQGSIKEQLKMYHLDIDDILKL